MINNKTPINELAAKAITGEQLDATESYSLITTSESEIQEICTSAAHLRDIGKGRIVTFSPKVFIPLTRLCRDYCGYCTFRLDPDETDTIFMSPYEVLEVAKKGETLGCTEALFTLGERPELRFPEAKKWLKENGYEPTLEYLAAMCRLVLDQTNLFPHANPGTMSRRELESLKPYNPSAGLMLESTSHILYQKGGPHEFAPSKRPAARLKTIETAGQLKVPFTTGLLIGIGETVQDRVDSLLAIRKLHQKYGHIQEVIIQNFRAKPKTPMENIPDAEDIDMLWTVAVSRIILGSDVNIQVPPNLNSDHYQMYLDAGINDWGGVSPLTIDYVNPEAPWPTLQNLKTKTESEGFDLRPRLPIYPEYFIDNEEYIPKSLKEKVESMTDDEGYVKGGLANYK